MFKLSSTFAIIGIAPKSKIASIVAMKLNAWVITSSPGLTPKALRPTFIAAVPDETQTQYLELNFLAQIFSNSLIWYFFLDL